MLVWLAIPRVHHPGERWVTTSNEIIWLLVLGSSIKRRVSKESSYIRDIICPSNLKGMMWQRAVQRQWSRRDNVVDSHFTRCFKMPLLLLRSRYSEQFLRITVVMHHVGLVIPSRPTGGIASLRQAMLFTPGYIAEKSCQEERWILLAWWRRLHTIV
jgi:hypothetical protein